MEELKKKEIFGYSLGGFGKNLAYVLVSSYTLYYYNSVLNVSASFVAVLLMVARIFDAFNDPIMAAVVAKTKGKHGRYKPWILSGAVLNSLVIVAMFTVPSQLNQTGIKVYITITYFLCGITYTISDIPYWSVIPAITQPGRARENLTLFTRIMSGIGTGLATAFTMLCVRQLGGGISPENYRKGFMIFACITAALYTFFTVITFINLPKERYEESSNISIKEIFSSLFHNDQALVVSAIIILFFSAISITMNLVLYVFEHENISMTMFGKDFDYNKLYTIYMVLVGVVEFLSMGLFYPVLRQKLSNRRIFKVGTASAMIGYIAFFVMVFINKKMGFWAITIPTLFLAFGLGIAYVLISVFIANAVDYGEKKTGKRQNSMISSLQTLMLKLSTSFSVFITGIGIDWIKYTDEVEQARDVIIRERLLFSVPPLLCVIVAFILLTKRKDL
ncbi:MAG: MFS transporter [Treponema sp.]|nr:MFS transporter [Treponema sp.]MBQ4236267.1 MFS transporter [Treponema sp.]MBQ5383555.1 MFS transporter [Treponema sp.]